MSSRVKQWMTMVLSALLGACAVVMWGAGSASASDCAISGHICGEVVNNSSLWIRAAGGSEDTVNGWCWGDSAPRYGDDDSPISCNHEAANVYTGENSNKYFHDTDSFRADSGCLTKFELGIGNVTPYWAVPGGHVFVEDRRGKAHDKWIKVWDTDKIEIDSQVCSGEPTKHYVNTWGTAHGYQDSYCFDNGDSGNYARCNPDGELYAANNYFFCKMWGQVVTDSNTYNHYWLLTDLDSVYSGRDGRSFVSAYFLSGGPNDTDNDSAYYYDSGTGTWKWIPDC